MYDSFRLVLAGAARDFLEGGVTRSRYYFRADDLEVDDPVTLPNGKVILVTFEYIDEPDGAVERPC